MPHTQPELPIIHLTDIQYHILSNLKTSEYCVGYWSLTTSKYTKEMMKPEIKKLKDMGLVEFHRGLIDDDGKAAGSGFCRAYKYNQLIEDSISKYENAYPDYLKDYWLPDKIEKVQANKMIHEQLHLAEQKAREDVLKRLIIGLKDQKRVLTDERFNDFSKIEYDNGVGFGFNQAVSLVEYMLEALQQNTKDKE